MPDNIQGLHYAVYTKDRMLLDDFKASVHESGSTGIGVRVDSGDGGAGGIGGGGDSEAGGSAKVNSVLVHAPGLRGAACLLRGSLTVL